jgi:NADPH:quinone reductase-like Zn-dependent oxidoreductase
VARVGPDVETLKVGDRVVSDTPVYARKMEEGATRWGGWQKYVVGRVETTAEVGRAIFGLWWVGC